MPKGLEREGADIFGTDEALEEAFREEQKVTARLEIRKFNKPMTILEGIDVKNNELNALAKSLKTYCACGGTAKEGKIFLQGDQRQKSIDFLKKNGFSRSIFTIV
ncbi:MAG TPA: stress response translation initiation inhibitor YciH [Thermoproteota archaeon]|nr:stress response translation initiation inhibitor YciH [Thermoproteota archaeon]